MLLPFYLWSQETFTTKTRQNQDRVRISNWQKPSRHSFWGKVRIIKRIRPRKLLTIAFVMTSILVSCKRKKSSWTILIILLILLRLIFLKFILLREILLKSNIKNLILHHLFQISNIKHRLWKKTIILYWFLKH